MDGEDEDGDLVGDLGDDLVHAADGTCCSHMLVAWWLPTMA